MEKIIDLLTEWKPDYIWLSLDFDRQSNIEYILSKKFGFIERLVKNNKIECPNSCAINKDDDYWERVIKSDYESLLMLLSISDSPIDDLISYLK